MKLLPPSRIDPLRNSDRPDEAFEASWRTHAKRRVVVMLCVLFSGTLVVEGRLVQLQVFRHDDYVTRAISQQQKVIFPTGMRGAIVDRNGEILAYSVHAKTIVADPTKIVDVADTAARLCAVLQCDTAQRASLVKTLQRDTSYAYVARQIPDEQAQRIVDLKLPGIAEPVDETRRYYPNRELAAHLLGAVNTDNKGIAGVEFAYDTAISGKKGRVQILNDARRSQAKKQIQVRVDQAPTEGATIELTIDMYLQHIVERELKAGVEANHAAGGTAIIMDPQTGAILALASYPTFNPNSFGEFTDQDRLNNAVQGMYEPGSTFKIVTAAAAIEEGVVQPTDLIDASAGQIKIGSRAPIKDTVNHGVLTFEDVIVESSNVGAVKVGMRVGADRLERYVRRFGFGQTLSPDFRGQSAGSVPAATGISDSTLASMSMGYEIGVTPLQMIAAVNSVANGGTLLEPHLVHAVVRGGVREVVAPKPLRQTINGETAATLTGFLENVVLRGTATSAKMDGYQVAGKTGTAAKLVDGHYSKSAYNASFVGFVPSRQPALTILVVIDSPSAGIYYGGAVAAPVFKAIASAALRQMSVPPTLNPVPSVVVGGTSRSVVSARPMAAEPVVIPAGGAALMPDVRGLGMRDAVRALGRVGLTVRAAGSGPVVSQVPAPGDPIESGSTCELQLQRATSDARPRSGGGS